MSYSRWSNSYWYTYWTVANEPENRDTATLEICGVMQIQARDIRENIDTCIENVREADKSPSGCMRANSATEADFRELKFLMLEFIEDVNDKYPEVK